ncbi:MAG: hypothetical protein AAGF12_35470 [Myxococcota bacterium]
MSASSPVHAQEGEPDGSESGPQDVPDANEAAEPDASEGNPPAVAGAEAENAPGDGEADETQDGAGSSATESSATESSATESSATEDEDDLDAEGPPSNDDLAEGVENGEANEEASGEDAEAEDAADDEMVVYGTGGGTYQLRVHGMSDLPLATLPRDETGETGDLDQNFWAEQWFRVNAEIGIRNNAKLVAEVDLFDGVVFGEFTEGVGVADRPREDASAFPGIELRKLYAEVEIPIGLLRLGVQTFNWGLGIVANDGARDTPFSDPRYGDVVFRLAFATRPLGLDVPFNVAIAGDIVIDDVIAEITDDEFASQGVLAAFYQEGERTIGGYVAYRSQNAERSTGAGTNFDDELRVFVGNIFARWDADEPSGGKIFGAVEAVGILGTTNETRSNTFAENDVRQFMMAAQLGRLHEDIDTILEVGYTTGDSNTEDDLQQRAVMDPDHRVGMLLFPEVLAWQSARSATLAQSELLTGRPSPGSQRLPTNGGVSGAAYLFGYTVYRPLSWLDLRLGMVWARATTDVVDPFIQRTESRSRNFRGGDPTRRDLGFEFDLGVRVRGEIARGIEVNGRLEGAVLLPGRAFDDDNGDRMNVLGLVRLGGGLTF